MDIQIRATRAEDLPALQAVIDATGLFPGEMLYGMAGPGVSGGSADEHWLTALVEGAPSGVAYVAPERMTEGCWNLLLIAVDPNRQGLGLGRRLTEAIERLVASRGARVLLVETSGLPEFEGTRGVYDRLGYDEEARIRDYYRAGEDKIVFRKALR